jgi:protein-S-isoprenylcysteine O-methyltransferase Ste14
MWLIILIGVALSLLFISWQKMFADNVLSFVLFFLAAIYWLIIFIAAWSVHCQAIRNTAEIDKIISTGIYRRVRHPMYSGDIILAWGFFLAFPYLSVLIGVLWLTVILLFWARLEEKAMTKKFGQTYLKYKSETPMLIPSWKK